MSFITHCITVGKNSFYQEFFIPKAWNLGIRIFFQIFYHDIQMIINDEKGNKKLMIRSLLYIERSFLYIRIEREENFSS